MGLSANHSASQAIQITWADRAGLLAALTATVLAFALTKARLDGLIGLDVAFLLAALAAMAHFAVVVVVAARRRGLVWSAYLLLTAIGFVAIGAVTPISAAVQLLRLNIG
jgi:hypothetical protein